MTEVFEVLRRWQAGDSARAIARAKVADRKTAGRYIVAAQALGLTRSSELTDDIVREVIAAVQDRPVPEVSAAWADVAKHRAQIEEWLKPPRPLRLTRVYELLVRAGIEASYATLWRYAHQELGWREKMTTVRVDDPPPGEEAQIDFGEMGMIELADGKRRKLSVLIVTLSLSRYSFVWPTFTQTLEDLCEGLDAAWQFFGGIAHRIVLDNMAAAIAKASPTAPDFTRSFLEYTQARGFFADPARVRRAQDKPRVERQVPYVRDRWFAGEVFPPALSAIRKHAEVWCRDVAGKRVHGTTRRIPREVFDEVERDKLLPAPTEPFDVPRWTRAKLHPDHHVQVERALYSAPTRHIGQTFEVRVDRRTVRLYLKSDLVKLHNRVGPGERSTDPDDYPTEKADAAFRRVDGVLKKAREYGAFVGTYAERLLDGPLPWTKMRQGYQLLRLCDRYGPDRVNDLCARALAFDVIDVPRIERMLKKPSQSLDPVPDSDAKVIRLPRGRFERDVSTFVTMTDPEKGGA